MSINSQINLVLNNPFRILGLPATATSRDIAKRISDLETFAELGKIRSYSNDFPALGPIDRTIQSIKDAARKIEQVEGRLLHSFFWFRASDSVDELALESMEAGNFKEAADIWDKQLSKQGVKKYTWRLNRGVLRLLDAAKQTLDTDRFDAALEDIGFVIDDDLDESISAVLAGNEASLRRESLWKRIVDELLVHVQSYPQQPYGKNLIRITNSFWSFPSEGRDYAASRIINPLTEQVQDAIKVSEALREADDFESLTLKNQLDKVEWIIKQLEEVLGEDDHRFQAIANAYADEVCCCAIKALNKFDNPKLSLMLINWADNLPSYSRIKARIEENKKTIEGWIKTENNEKLYSDIYKILEINITRIIQASTIFDNMKNELLKIKKVVGILDEDYLKISSACAHHILGFLIETINDAQKTLSIINNEYEFQSRIKNALELTKKLLTLDVDNLTKVRINENLKIIEGINSQLNAAVVSRIQSSSSSSSSNIFENIPGWLWIVGIVFLLAMCSSK